MRRLGAALALGLAVSLVPSAVPATASGPNLAERFTLPDDVRQLVTVTSPRWSDRAATLSAWRRTAHGWRRVRGPMPARLGYGGWVKAAKRVQSTGTTPAGRFRIPQAFGVRSDPGTTLRYRHVDANDYWPYEPRDPRTYNIYQPSKAPGTSWRADYSEHLAGYPVDYAYAAVIGFNLPQGVHWSTKRRQWVADEVADTARGGGIFLHARDEKHTAGCVAVSRRQMRWLLRWLDPDRAPRIIMGPRKYVTRRF